MIIGRRNDKILLHLVSILGMLMLMLLSSSERIFVSAKQIKIKSNNIKYRGNEKNNDISPLAITSFQNEYNDVDAQHELMRENVSEFRFQRFQSPSTIKNALHRARTRKSNSRPFKWHQGKDGRRGYISSTKLVGDWVLAESEQIAKDCTTEEVLRAYLSGDLQQKWNAKEVLECHFKCKAFDEAPSNKESIAPNSRSQRKHKRVIEKSIFPSKAIKENRNNNKKVALGKYYEQDLVLRSQRVIRSHTGIMRYTQTITIDKIGPDNYSVIVRLDPANKRPSFTSKKPFESLSVYVGLQQHGDDVGIYAAGVMEVNRKVVPNLLVFDASGIAGSMAGKGTLWLAGYFHERNMNMNMNMNRNSKQ